MLPVTEGESVLEQLFHAYQNSQAKDLPKIKAAFRKIDFYVSELSATDPDAGFQLICELCILCEKRALTAIVQYGAHLMQELWRP